MFMCYCFTFNKRSVCRHSSIDRNGLGGSRHHPPSKRVLKIPVKYDLFTGLHFTLLSVNLCTSHVSCVYFHQLMEMQRVLLFRYAGENANGLGYLIFINIPPVCIYFWRTNSSQLTEMQLCHKWACHWPRVFF